MHMKGFVVRSHVTNHYDLAMPMRGSIITFCSVTVVSEQGYLEFIWLGISTMLSFLDSKDNLSSIKNSFRYLFFICVSACVKWCETKVVS